jgi:hypothetical protein
MEWLSELRAQRDALEQELMELERAAGRRPPRLTAVAGKAMPAVDERAAVLLLRLGIVNDALAAVRDASHHRGNAAIAILPDKADHPSRHARRPQ